MPLTGLLAGECAASPGALVPMDRLRDCCNRGHARTSCPHAATIEPDAAQFLVQSDRAGVIEIAWAIEKNHHPVAVGTLQIDSAPQPSLSQSGSTLQHQARAFAANYLRQKGRA
jgi:hypothetical protein